VAKRGHKLLKDKLDELMRQFMELIKGFKQFHLEVEEQLIEAYRSFIRARAGMPLSTMEAILHPEPERMLAVQLDWANVMSVRVPRLSLTGEITWEQFGFAATGGDLDLAMHKFAQLFPKMISLAEQKRTIELLALDIERTRRRVNALEYVLIPNLEETIRDISMKLSESELANQIRLMKIKEMMEAQKAG